jgi:Flp pilus assembly secretin CpaC
MIRWVLVALILSSKSVFAQTAAGPDTVLAKCLNKATEYAVEIKCGATLALEPEHVRLLTLDRSFASVIVGSEDVADVQIPDPQDNRTVLITAKSLSALRLSLIINHFRTGYTSTHRRRSATTSLGLATRGTASG